jgi:phosphoribosylformimino-5-aminoimidazole carboxamide ribotide isomerase
LAFSLDLFDGRVLGNWNSIEPQDIVERVVDAGIRRIIVLDLARVGLGSGIGTEDLLESLIHRFANVEFVAGGGVRNRDDLNRLESLGVAGVLMASALHDGLL